MITTRTDYHVVTVNGQLICTRDDRQKAYEFADDNAGVFPGLSVRKVRITEAEIYRPRPLMMAVA